MKIIDLLNRIANGEIKLGTKFNWHYKMYDIELIFTKRQGALGLYFQREDRLIGLFERFNYQILNDEVEIIEEDKKIPEKISLEIDKFEDSYYDTALIKVASKIDELIDYLDYLKSKGDE